MPAAASDLLDENDRAALRAHGLSEKEAIEQLELFANPPERLRLERPATRGDGIETIEPTEHEELLALWKNASEEGRLSKFVPASGAATRMFEAFLSVRAEDPEADLARWESRAATEPRARALVAFRDGLPRFAFFPALREVVEARGEDLDALVARGRLGPILSAMLDADGLAFATLPKALIPFHRDGGASRTPFEEQLDEALETVPAGSSPTRVHFTVSSEARDLFLDALEEAARTRPGAAFDVDFSEQSPATDTLAADEKNRPFRDASGALVFRPGGHGALLANLQATAGDVVLVKNIDNVQHRSRRATTLLWKKLLAGFLLRAERGRTDAGRPLRVCGVVRNEGEPGGGPYWVKKRDGRSTLQIVEASEVDAASPGQKAILSAATHFNPVDLVCLLRDPSRRPYDLARFVDPSAVFFAKKSKDGRELRALERPGLWNGGMAEWETLFVEVPPETFSPVKTVLDLLRPAHQPLV